MTTRRLTQLLALLFAREDRAAAWSDGHARWLATPSVAPAAAPDSRVLPAGGGRAGYTMAQIA